MPVVDPLEPWRLKIKAMGGESGPAGKTTITINGTTRLWTRTAAGTIAEWTHINASAGGPYAVEPIVIPANQLSDHLSGGSFYKLLEGPNKGKYISKWSNEIGTPYPTGATKWGDISINTNTPSFNRGPGATLLSLTHAAAHLAGASMNYNAAGEMHFTMLVNDPNVTIPLPKRTHYSIEFYQNGTWVERFAGLVWDLDQTDTEVVFYGVDYLGLLQYIVDERFDPLHPHTKAPVGSKYVKRTITEIITAHLQYSIDLKDSPVGFIQVGHIGSMKERVTIWSAMNNSLAFVVGLIDSHRAGSSRFTRLSVDKIDGIYKFHVEENPGANVNIDLVYGDLAQGYRAIPFGTSWASRVNYLGRPQASPSTILYKAGTSAVDEGVWGRISQAPVIVDVADKNDLARRAKQGAVEASRLGRSLSVGVRLGAFAPMENYGIPDYVGIVINQGAVRTGEWNNKLFGADPPGDPHLVGGAYWAIVGITWESFDDGHWVTNLGLFPTGVISGLTVVGQNHAVGVGEASGSTWDTNTAGLPVTGNFLGIAWSIEQRKFVGVGTAGKLFTSLDGRQWIEHDSSFDGSDIHGVTYSPELDRWVAVGDGDEAYGSAKVATSPDGMTWTQQSNTFGTVLPTNFPDSVSPKRWSIGCVAWSPEQLLFVAGGGLGQIITSPDGFSWSLTATGQTEVDPTPPIVNGTPEYDGYVYSVAWSPKLNLWVVGIHSHSDIDSLTFVLSNMHSQTATSPDGLVWTLHTVPDLQRDYHGAAWSPALDLFAMAGDNFVQTSPDGLVWTDQDDGITGGFTLYGLIWAQQLLSFVAVGMDTSGGVVTMSGDGVTWNVVLSQPRALYAVAWSGIAETDPSIINPRSPLAVGDGPPSITDPTNTGNTDTYIDRVTGQLYTWNDDTLEWDTTGSPSGPTLYARVWNATPDGDVDGANDTFTLTFTPIGLILSKNGMIQQPGGGNDYTLAGKTITFLTSNIPATGDILLATYDH